MKFIKHFLMVIVTISFGFFILWTPAAIIKALTGSDMLVQVYLMILCIAIIAREAYKRTKKENSE